MYKNKLMEIGADFETYENMGTISNIYGILTIETKDIIPSSKVFIVASIIYVRIK